VGHKSIPSGTNLVLFVPLMSESDLSMQTGPGSCDNDPLTHLLHRVTVATIVTHLQCE
jgi:hypothetical protein